MHLFSLLAIRWIFTFQMSICLDLLFWFSVTITIQNSQTLDSSYQNHSLSTKKMMVHGCHLRYNNTIVNIHLFFLCSNGIATIVFAYMKQPKHVIPCSVVHSFPSPTGTKCAFSKEQVSWKHYFLQINICFLQPYVAECGSNLV